MLGIHWFLPTGGDSRDVLPSAPDAIRRAPDLAYLAQVATACDALGFDAMLTPCGTGCEDAWLATAALVALTRRIKFLVAFRPALLTPTLAAQMASTHQRLSNGRLLVNIVTGEVSWRNLSGPVTIADYAGKTARLGMTYYLNFIALVSISLGVLNLLPIPMLDGGHLLYYLAEILRGKPVSERVMEIGSRLGFAVVITTMALAFYNDIHRLLAG